MDLSEAKRFCEQWLPRWTGGDATALLECYAEESYYRDPGRADGIDNKKELAAYLSKLLAANPQWTWRPVEIIPTEKGFTLKWAAEIPVGEQLICETGLDIVDVEAGKITRNEVYFDRCELLAAYSKVRERK